MYDRTDSVPELWVDRDEKRPRRGPRVSGLRGGHPARVREHTPVELEMEVSSDAEVTASCKVSAV